MTQAEPQHPIRVVAAAIEQHAQYLITQRRPTAIMPLLWEFPGGRVETGETDQKTLSREVLFRLGVELHVGELVRAVSHSYERYAVTLHLYQCTIAQGEPRAKNVKDFAWVGADEFEDYWFTPADDACVAALLGSR